MEKWEEAHEAEYNLLIGYNTWMLAEKPSDKNIIRSRWIFRLKQDNLGQIDWYKARLVAQGFSQIPGVDFNKTYSPTIQLTSIQLIITLA